MWPFSYEELAPYYSMAEDAMHVAGNAGEDPCEASRPPYPYPARPHEDCIAELDRRLRNQGLSPFHLPLAINTAKCRNGSPCDGFPCRIKAKHDAEVSFIAQIIHNQNVTLWTNSYVARLETDASGLSVEHAVIIKDDAELRVSARHFLLAAGAINSALLLLRSQSRQHPRGLANSSGLVGRNYMTHINTVMLAHDSYKKNPSAFQKTLAINDFYTVKSSTGAPLGSIQLRGKIRPENLHQHRNPIIRMLRHQIALRSIDFWLMTEDFPDPDNRVMYTEDGEVALKREYNNMRAHQELCARWRKTLQRAGYRCISTDLRDIRAVQHQCGTICCGMDKKRSVLNKYCQSYELANLFVVDASIFPSSGALNPALTVAANALRVADYIISQKKKE